MSVHIKTGHRTVTRRGGEYEPDEVTTIATAEIWIDGVCYRTDAANWEQAAKLVADASRTLLDSKLAFNITVDTTSVS